MGNNKKVVNTLLMVLGVLILLEVVALLTGFNPLDIYSYLTGKKPSVNQTLPTNVTITDFPENTNQNDSLVEYLKNRTSKQTLISSQLVDKYQGKISEFKIEDGTSLINNFQYSLLIGIKDNEDGSRRFAYNKNDLKKLQVYKLDGGKMVKITINDLKIGDEITIEETQDIKITDCSKSECFLKYEIIKL